MVFGAHGQIWTAGLSLTKGVLYPWATWAKIIGAGEGNRTLTVSLEGFCSTIELHPQTYCINAPTHWNLVVGEGFEPSKLSQQIYSLPPLTARESHQRDWASYSNLKTLSNKIRLKRWISTQPIVLKFYFSSTMRMYFAYNSSCVSGCSSSINMQSTGHTCWHCGSS